MRVIRWNTAWNFSLSTKLSIEVLTAALVTLLCRATKKSRRKKVFQ